MKDIDIELMSIDEIQNLWENKDTNLIEYILRLNKNILSIIDSLDLLCNCINYNNIKKCAVEVRFCNPFLAEKLKDNPLLQKLNCNFITMQILDEESWLKDNFYISYDLANLLGFYSNNKDDRYIQSTPNPIISEIFKFVTIRIIKIQNNF